MFKVGDVFMADSGRFFKVTEVILDNNQIVYYLREFLITTTKKF